MPPFISGVPFLGTMAKYGKDPQGFVVSHAEKVRSSRQLVSKSHRSACVQYGVYTIDLAGRDAVVLSDRKALEQYYAAPEYGFAVFSFPFAFTDGLAPDPNSLQCPQ